MSTFHPSPDFDCYYNVCRKGDPETKAVAVSQNAGRVLADASEIRGSTSEQFRVGNVLKHTCWTANLHVDFR
jgi:hypothetical protein